ncbi:MAG TPA: tripartite tricarboxylate transporter substrate binding protein [Burkholderiales bacterium]|nr:tripartite tricarboxylate transporter substrate binding protein [Burkholderiales bacterium]
MTTARTFLAIVLLAASAALVPDWSAHAQGWPAKPLRWIVPYPPGGSTDIAARPLAERVGQALGGQSGIVENRAGAAGNIGIEAAAKSAPDGHTLLVAPDSIASNPHLFKVGWDPFRDFVPVIQLSRQPVVLAVHPSLGVSSLAELVAAARQKPGLGFATSGAGSQQQMAAEWFAKLAGIQLTHVPYKGGGQAITDLVGGQIQIGSLGSSPLIPHYKAGKLKLIAQSTAARAPSLPEVPTYEESGYRGLVIEQWLGIFVPAGTPAEIVARLNAEIGKALAESGIRERYAAAAMEPVGGTAESLARLLRGDYDKYGRLIRELSIRLE